MNEIGKQFTPDFLIYWKELGEIRKARYEQKQLKGEAKRVFLDEKMKNLKGLIKDEEIMRAVSEEKNYEEILLNLFEFVDIKTQEDAISAIIPTGTPDYGEAMGVSFDDPVNSMEKMAKAYLALKSQAQQNQEIWQRYLNLAAKPTGISCEYCCGIGAQGIDSKGNSRCGCQHNPALQSVTIWLMINTEYSDAEVLKEVYKWKALFFPKDMVGLAIKISGGDDSVLEDLPGMVGGC